MADRTCHDFHGLISAFIDGEATREENSRLRQHLATCADCRATLDAYRGIGGSLRALPAVYAPQHLTDSIFAQTIDAEPRRLFLITSRLGYSLAAVASILLIFVVATYLIIGGYERGIEPAVASSRPTQEQTWQIQRPVEIEFNKDMNRESVIAALGMIPSEEEKRLSQTWDGNTLIIGDGTPFKPETYYEIKISTDATDKWGNSLSEPFELAFTTSKSQTTVQTPTPEALATATAEPARSSPTAEMTEPAVIVSPSRTPDASATPTTTPDDDSAPTSATGTAIVPDNPIGPSLPTATPIPLVPTATPEPTEPSGSVDPTATATSSPTASMTPVPPTSTVAATATATATETATVPLEPTVTPTLESIPVIGAIGDVYWRDQAVQDRLGSPVAAGAEFETNQLDFQRGVMMLDQFGENIYVFKFGSGWDMFGVPSGEQPAAEEMPEGGIYSPGGVFGTLWESDQSIQDSVGFALNRYAISYTGTIQRFTSGWMIATPTTVYVVYDDRTWDWFTYTAS